MYLITNAQSTWEKKSVHQIQFTKKLQKVQFSKKSKAEKRLLLLHSALHMYQILTVLQSSSFKNKFVNLFTSREFDAYSVLMLELGKV